MKPAYKRILIKVSGEALMGPMGKIDVNILGNICDNIKKVHDMGVEVALVIGGGNIWRGKFAVGMERTTADYMGMLATVINSLAFQDALEFRGLDTRVQTAIEMRQIAEPYISRKAVRHLEKGRIVIFAAGTGNPFFSTDTAAALRTVETGADVLLLAKSVDGVYDKDPDKDKSAVMYDKVTYLDVLNKGLEVMDSTATSLCMDNKIPIRVFGISTPENIVKIVCGENIGTVVQ